MKESALYEAKPIDDETDDIVDSFHNKAQDDAYLDLHVRSTKKKMKQRSMSPTSSVDAQLALGESDTEFFSQLIRQRNHLVDGEIDMWDEAAIFGDMNTSTKKKKPRTIFSLLAMNDNESKRLILLMFIKREMRFATLYWINERWIVVASIWRPSIVKSRHL